MMQIAADKPPNQRKAALRNAVWQQQQHHQRQLTCCKQQQHKFVHSFNTQPKPTSEREKSVLFASALAQTLCNTRSCSPCVCVCFLDGQIGIEEAKRCSPLDNLEVFAKSNDSLSALLLNRSPIWSNRFDFVCRKHRCCCCCSCAVVFEAGERASKQIGTRLVSIGGADAAAAAVVAARLSAQILSRVNPAH